MIEDESFELADELAPDPEPVAPPAPRAAVPRAAPPKPETPTTSARATGVPTDAPLVSARRKGRLLRLVPGLAVGFLLVGWICLGSHAWPFALTGAALGAWAAWNRRSEVLLGTLAAVVGLATWFAIVGFLPGIGMGIAIVGCGIVGFLAGLDDRLRGAGTT